MILHCEALDFQFLEKILEGYPRGYAHQMQPRDFFHSIELNFQEFQEICLKGGIFFYLQCSGPASLFYHYFYLFI